MVSTCDVLSAFILIHPCACMCLLACVTCHLVVTAILALILRFLLRRGLCRARVGSKRKIPTSIHFVCSLWCATFFAEFTGLRFVHTSFRDTDMGGGANSSTDGYWSYPGPSGDPQDLPADDDDDFDEADGGGNADDDMGFLQPFLRLLLVTHKGNQIVAESWQRYGWRSAPVRATKQYKHWKEVGEPNTTTSWPH